MYVGMIHTKSRAPREEADASPGPVQAAPALSSRGDQRGRGLMPEERKPLSEAMKKRRTERRKGAPYLHAPVA